LQRLRKVVSIHFCSITETRLLCKLRMFSFVFIDLLGFLSKI
jgi:hypothetical protein